MLPRPPAAAPRATHRPTFDASLNSFSKTARPLRCFSDEWRSYVPGFATNCGLKVHSSTSRFSGSLASTRTAGRVSDKDASTIDSTTDTMTGTQPLNESDARTWTRARIGVVPTPGRTASHARSSAARRPWTRTCPWKPATAWRSQECYDSERDHAATTMTTTRQRQQRVLHYLSGFIDGANVHPRSPALLRRSSKFAFRSTACATQPPNARRVSKSTAQASDDGSCSVSVSACHAAAHHNHAAHHDSGIESAPSCRACQRRCRGARCCPSASQPAPA